MKINKMSGRIHPLMAAAAVSVTLVSLIGVAAITGILPTSKATQGANTTTAVPPVQTALMAPSQPQQLAQTNANGSLTAAPVHHATPTHHTQPHHTRPATDGMQQQAAAQTCLDCGRVESVDAVQAAAPASGVGVGVGAVVGGLLGNQVGKGNGRTLATIAGAVGGGFAGNEVEKRTHTTTTYQVRVRMEDGEVRSFPQSSANGWRAGDRVRVVNGALTSRG
jgi:outer membrane lipoprotein SlyB